MEFNAIIINILYELGIHKRYKGVRYILSCIDYIENNKQNFLPITKILYVDVAKLHNTSKYNIEKGIRDIIDRIWNGEENRTVIKMTFGTNYIDQKPSNTEFLITLYDYIKSHIREMNDDDKFGFICPRCAKQCPFCKDSIKTILKKTNC